MDSHKVRIAVIGLHFGAAFVPIYQSHPDVDQVALCDLNIERLNAVGERFGITASRCDCALYAGRARRRPSASGA